MKTGKMDNFKIKKDKIDSWKKEAGNNAMNPYFFGVVVAVVKSFEVLDNPNSTMKEVDEAWAGLDLTGFMAGTAAQMIGEFHERGDEFRVYWNKRWGVIEEEAKGGTVIPAIMT